MILREINKFKLNHKKPQSNLPTLFFFTNRHQFSDIFSVIKNLPRNSGVIIREYDLDFAQRLEFAKKIVKIAKERHLLTFAGKDLRLALQAKTNGVHFSDQDQRQKQYLSYQKSNPHFLFSYSCHSEKSLKKAARFNFDFLFLSPIFPTNSHQESLTINHQKLTRISLNNNFPLYALGGINSKNIKLLKKSRIYGIGAISLISKLIS